jgi:sugar O-acyltransferase (sialic acid O-acetyltransferase NeuD family)
MSRPLLLVGSGGLAREAAEAARAAGAWHLVGFVDDDPARWGTGVGGLPVLGGVDHVCAHPEAQLLLCPGSGTARLRLAERLRALGIGDDRYATVIHPSVSVPSSCSVSPGSVLLAGTALTADVTIGLHVVCMPQVVLTHDNVLHEGATLAAAAVLGGSVVVGRRAYLGMACSVREGVRIGEAATIGMGAVVLNNVPDGQTWVGVPAADLDPRRRAG